MKIDITKKAEVQTSLRLPKEQWEKIITLAKENKCSNQDVIRYMVTKFFKQFNNL